MITVAAVAEALGLPGMGVETAVNRRNKLSDAAGVRRAGAPHPVPADPPGRGACRGGGVRLSGHRQAHARRRQQLRVQGRLHRGAGRAVRAGTEGSQDMSWARSEAEGLDLGPSGLLVESFLDGAGVPHRGGRLGRRGLPRLHRGPDHCRGRAPSTTTCTTRRRPLSPQAWRRCTEAVAAGMRAQGLRRSVGHAEVASTRSPAPAGDRHRGSAAADSTSSPGSPPPTTRSRRSPIARGARPRVRHFQPTGTHATAMCLICEAGTIASVHVPAEVSESERDVRPEDHRHGRATSSGARRTATPSSGSSAPPAPRRRTPSRP